MFRRALCCALTALAFATATSPAQAPRPTGTSASRPAPTDTRPSADPGRATPSSASTSYAVSYRKAGDSAWTELRTFPNARAAQDAARSLYQKGYEVQVLARTTLTHLPPRPKTADLPVEKTVTVSQARQIFSWMANQKDIAFRYPVDGCYARAHLMITRMQSRGYKPYKVWSFANGDPLYVKTPHVRSGHVEWKYHVAPALRVRAENGKQSWAVIDPSMFKGPVTIATWKNAQKKPGGKYQPHVTVTALGVAPKDATGHRLPGTGYWPGLDPKEGPTRHALVKMADYKRKEPRTVATLSLPGPEAHRLTSPARAIAMPDDRRRAA